MMSRHSLKRSPNRQRTKGSVTVELAVAFPMLLVVFLVMLFFMDLIMVKQEVSSIGFAAMRECSALEAPERPTCLLEMIRITQLQNGSNDRYSCNAQPTVQTIPGSGGKTIQVVNLNCQYDGMTFFDTITLLGGPDIRENVRFQTPVFFPEI